MGQLIRDIQVEHRKELERDLLVESITKLLIDLLANRQTEELRRLHKTQRFVGDKELKKAFKDTEKAAKRLKKIILISVGANKKFLRKLKTLKQKIEGVRELTDKSNKGVDNIYEITVNQISWREKTIGFFEKIGLKLDKIGLSLTDHVERFDALRDLQFEIHDIVKEELGIQDTNINFENLVEHEDLILQKIEEYYFGTQKTTIDTAINRRRSEFKALQSRIIGIVQSVNLFLVPVGCAMLKYPRLLGKFAEQDAPGIKDLRKKHKDLIERSVVKIPTRKGYTLEGTYFSKQGCDKVIVILHENVHGMFHQLINALEYKSDYNVLLYNNSGHFGSGGHAGLGLEEAEDFTDVLNWLIDEKKNKAIGVYGVSLGGATAIGGIAYLTRQDYVKAAVFQAAFSDRDDVMRDYSEDLFKLPNCKIRRIMKWAVERKYKGRTKYTPKELIRHIRCPIYLIADIEDPFMRFYHAKELAKNARDVHTYFRHGREHYYPENKIKRHLVYAFLKEHLE